MRDEDLIMLFEQLLKLEDNYGISIGKFECQAVELILVIREAILWRLAEAG